MPKHLGIAVEIHGDKVRVNVIDPDDRKAAPDVFVDLDPLAAASLSTILMRAAGRASANIDTSLPSKGN